jgi:glutamine amidotransferase
MCLLVARKAGSNWLPSREEFDNAWDSNPHGFGASWKSDQLWINKSLDQEEAWKIIQEIPAGAPCIMHWRFATHGVRTVANCHPWAILGGKWVGAHNGVLSRQPLVDGMTDSQSFMLGLKGKEPRIKGIERAIDRLGTGKMAFISQSGEIRIANEQQGDWRVKGEVWESNNSLDSIPYWKSATYWPDERPSCSMHMSQFSSNHLRKSKYSRLRCGWCNHEATLYDVHGEACCWSCIEDVEAWTDGNESRPIGFIEAPEED